MEKSNLSLVFVNRFLLAQSCLSIYVFAHGWGTRYRVAYLKQNPYASQSLKYFIIGPLREKIADPCLENPMDRGAWQATVRRAAKELDTTE